MLSLWNRWGILKTCNTAFTQSHLCEAYISWPAILHQMNFASSLRLPDNTLHYQHLAIPMDDDLALYYDRHTAVWHDKVVWHILYLHLMVYWFRISRIDDWHMPIAASYNFCTAINWQESTDAGIIQWSSIVWHRLCTTRISRTQKIKAVWLASVCDSEV